MPTLPCPKCGSDADQRIGALYHSCAACDYAWVPVQDSIPTGTATEGVAL